MNTKYSILRRFFLNIVIIALFVTIIPTHFALATADHNNGPSQGNNFRDTPGIELVAPKDGRVVNSLRVELRWSITEQGGAPLVFDVFVSEEETKVTESDLEVRIGSNIQKTSLKAMILRDGKTYCWKVVGLDVENNTEIESPVNIFSLDSSIADAGSYLGISISDPNPDYREEVFLAAIVPDTFGRYIMYSWSFSDDSSMVEGNDKAKVVHSFEDFGIQTVYLTVSDELGNEQSTSIQVVIEDGEMCAEECAEDEGASSLIVMCGLVIFITIIIVIIIIAAQTKEKERQKKQFALPDDLYRTKERAAYSDKKTKDFLYMEDEIEIGFRKMTEEIRKMTRATKDLIKGEKFGRFISILIVVFAVSTMITAYLQSETNQKSTEEYGSAKTNLEDSNTFLLKAESIMDNDQNLLDEARRYYLEGENLWWKYVQRSLNGTPGTYYNEKGDALIAFNNAYGLIGRTNMQEQERIRSTYSVNLEDFDDFVPWDYPDEQVKIISIDILKILDEAKNDLEAYESELKEKSARLRNLADIQFETAKERGDEGLLFTKITTIFSIATSVIGISIVPKNKYTRKFLILFGIGVYAFGFFFVYIS